MNATPATPNILLNPLFAQLGEQRHVLVGFSGGLDSSVLLHLLVCLRDQLIPDLMIVSETWSSAVTLFSPLP